MAASVANARKANTSGANTTTTTSFTSTAGSTIWVGVSDASGQGSLTISDNKGNTYTQIGTTRTSGSGAQIRRFYCANIAGGAGHTVTATWGSNSDATVHVLELAGVATASLDSAASAQADDNNPPWTVTSGTLAQADSIAVAMTGTAFAGTWSESSGFTVQTQEGDNNLYWTGCAASRVVAATTALTPSFTISGGGSDCAVAVDVFKAAAAGGVTGTAAWTEDDDVAALTGAAEVTGSAGWTEADDTAALTGVAEVSGTLEWTEADDLTAIAAEATASGSAAWTEENDAAALTGTVGTVSVSGDIAWTEEDDLAALTGTSSGGVQLLGGGPGGPRKRSKGGTESYLERLLGRPLDEEPEQEEIEVIEQAAEVAAKAPQPPERDEAADSLRAYGLALKDAYVEIYLELEHKKRQAMEEQEIMAVIAICF
jgi:hypothetical protein